MEKELLDYVVKRADVRSVSPDSTQIAKGADGESS